MSVIIEEFLIVVWGAHQARSQHIRYLFVTGLGIPSERFDIWFHTGWEYLCPQPDFLLTWDIHRFVNYFTPWISSIHASDNKLNSKAGGSCINAIFCTSMSGSRTWQNQGFDTKVVYPVQMFFTDQQHSFTVFNPYWLIWFDRTVKGVADLSLLLSFYIATVATIVTYCTSRFVWI